METLARSYLALIVVLAHELLNGSQQQKVIVYEMPIHVQHGNQHEDTVLSQAQRLQQQRSVDQNFQQIIQLL